MMTHLDGKVAIVSGAGRGVGRATARRLAAAGARVVVNDMDEDEASSCVQSILDAGGQAIPCVGDVTDLSFPERFIDASLSAFGGIDIVVNNAGYIWNGAMHNHSDEQLSLIHI